MQKKISAISIEIIFSFISEHGIRSLVDIKIFISLVPIQIFDFPIAFIELWKL